MKHGCSCTAMSYMPGHTVYISCSGYRGHHMFYSVLPLLLKYFIHTRVAQVANYSMSSTPIHTIFITNILHTYVPGIYVWCVFLVKEAWWLDEIQRTTTRFWSITVYRLKHADVRIPYNVYVWWYVRYVCAVWTPAPVRPRGWEKTLQQYQHPTNKCAPDVMCPCFLYEYRLKISP